MTDFPNPDSKEYKLSAAVASKLRERTNIALGDILTLIESVLGNEDSRTESTKKLIKQMMWDCSNDNQHMVYYAFGIEDRQIGDSGYIEKVLNGTDKEITNPGN